MDNVTEYTLSTNEKNVPNILHGGYAISQLLLQLILLEPGTNTNHPKMGVGLVSKFRYGPVDELSPISTEIKRQINEYLPEFAAINIELTADNQGVLGLNFMIDGTIYPYSINVDEKNVTVADLLEL